MTRRWWPWRRLTGHAWLQDGPRRYEVTFARLGRDIETVTVGARHPQEATEKALRYLTVNLIPRVTEIPPAGALM